MEGKNEIYDNDTELQIDKLKLLLDEELPPWTQIDQTK